MQKLQLIKIYCKKKFINIFNKLYFYVLKLQIYSINYQKENLLNNTYKILKFINYILMYVNFKFYFH
jgi:hypothetical protein